MMTVNQRREARVDVQVPVRIYRGRHALALESVDVSFRGLFVRTMNPPPLRSLVKLKVALGERTFEAHAMVVHVVDDPSDPACPRPAGVGLQFWGLSGPDRTVWDDFVRGLVHVARSAGRPRVVQITADSGAMAASSPHPALSEPPTPSGVHCVLAVPRASSK